MLVEHTFITTLEPHQALAAAAEFLQARGFVSPPQTTFQLGDQGWRTLEATRGVANARAKTLLDLPQSIRVEWDRGRVDVAATMTPRPTGSGRSLWFSGFASAGDAGTLGRNKRYDMAMGELLVTMARSLELVMSHGRPDLAANEWGNVEVQLRTASDQQRRRNRRFTIIVVSIAGAVILLAILGMIMAIQSSS